MADTVKFNWFEIYSAGNHHFEAILILTYCLKMGYNKQIANSSKHLMKILGITHIPLDLFRRGYLKAYNGKIFSLYKCKEPITYFNNASFITANTQSHHKVHYLYMLGHRHLNNYNTYIPKEYINESLWNNPFVTIENERLNFIPEITQEKNK